MIKLWIIAGTLGAAPENALELKGEEWIKDLAKTRKTQIRRSLDGTLYSFIDTDRGNTRLYEHTLSFTKLDKERISLLKAFINSAEGKLCGWQDGLGGIHAVIIKPEQISVVSASRAAGDREDEWHSASFKLQIIRSLSGQLS